MDGAGRGGKEAVKGRFSEQRERERQNDVWPQIQAAEGEGKCKGRIKELKTGD